MDENRFFCFSKNSLSDESPADQNIRSFYKFYEQLMGLAFQVTFSSDEFEKRWNKIINDA